MHVAGVAHRLADDAASVGAVRRLSREDDEAEFLVLEAQLRLLGAAVDGGAGDTFGAVAPVAYAHGADAVVGAGRGGMGGLR